MRKKKCKGCKNYQSYRYIYEDELEPTECGICNLTGEHVSEDDICKPYVGGNK
jgi:hypothetical protein